MAASAADVPPNRFDDLPLSPESKVAMREGFGFEYQTPVQAHMFGPIIRGVDLVAAKAVADQAQSLSLSIEDNLKPTVQWLREFGLSDTQVAKAVAGYPRG